MSENDQKATIFYILQWVENGKLVYWWFWKEIQRHDRIRKLVSAKLVLLIFKLSQVISK